MDVNLMRDTAEAMSKSVESKLDELLADDGVAIREASDKKLREIGASIIKSKPERQEVYKELTMMSSILDLPAEIMELVDRAHRGEAKSLEVETRVMREMWRRGIIWI